MTTIACNLKVIAADSKCTWGDTDVGFSCMKLFKVGESIYGTRGDNHSNLFVEWAKAGFKRGRKPSIVGKDPDFTILELSPSGISIWDEFFVRIELKDKNFAVGSGAKIALYCMRHHNMSPEDAVKEAAKVDEYTKLPVDVWRLHDAAPNATPEKT